MVNLGYPYSSCVTAALAWTLTFSCVGRGGFDVPREPYADADVDVGDVDGRAPGDLSRRELVKTTQQDFETAGSTRQHLDTTTTPGDLVLSGVADTAMVSGPDLTASAASGSHTLERPNGTFLIIHGGNTATSSVYDPVGNGMTPGPQLTSTVGAGATSVKLADGTFLVIHGGEQASTSVYDPVANTVAAGPNAPQPFDTGTNALAMPDGRFLLMHSNASAATMIYDPAGNAFSLGPPTTGVQSRGGLNIPRPDGSFLIIHGTGVATSIFTPDGASMAAGPSLTGAIGAGGHALGLSDGNYLIVHGEDAITTSLYDPVANAMSAGPTFPPLGEGDRIWNGSFSIQRCDGTFLVVGGAADAGTTYTYDPQASSLTKTGISMRARPETGAHAIQLPTDGTYLMLHGGTPPQATTAHYDAGCPTRGVYESEPLHPAGIVDWDTLTATTTAGADIAFEVRTATDAGSLADASYAVIANGAKIPVATNNSGAWAQVRITFRRALPAMPGASESVSRGQSTVTAYRQFATTALQSLTLGYFAAE